MKTSLQSLLFAFCAAAAFLPGISAARGGGHTSHNSGPHYGGGHHTTNHGGHYTGGSGSSHKGGHYRNPRTSNHYGHHK
jgi:hypothetical protein